MAIQVYCVRPFKADFFVKKLSAFDNINKDPKSRRSVSEDGWILTLAMLARNDTVLLWTKTDNRPRRGIIMFLTTRVFQRLMFAPWGERATSWRGGFGEDG